MGAEVIEPEDFPADDSRGGLPPDIPDGEEQL